MKIIKHILVGGFFFFLIQGFSAFAISSIPYCSKSESYTCVSREYSLVDFLNNLDASYYYEPPSYSPSDDYIIFEDPYFKFYIPDYIVEWILIDVDYGTYFGKSDWEKIDKDFNKVPDEIDDLIELFYDVEDDYFGEKSQYKFDRWNDKVPVLIDFTLYDSLIDEGGCLFGSYSIDGVVRIDPTGVLDDFLGVEEYCGERSKEDVESTIAHEIFHVIQSVYINFDAFWNSYIYDNFFEGTAVTMARNLVGGSDEYIYYLDSSPYLYPMYSIFGPPSSSLQDANYGSFIWYNFLIRKYGKDFVEKLLNTYEEASQYEDIYRTFIAVSDALIEEDSDIEEAYLEYVTWNYDKDKYTYGNEMREVYITKTHKSFPTGDILVDGDEAPALFASNYIEFNMGSSKNLEVLFTACADADMYLTFLSVNDGDVDYDLDVNYFVNRGETMIFTVPSYGNDTVVMIVSVLDINDEGYNTENIFYDYVYPYSYSADRVAPTVVEETVGEILEDLDLSEYFIFELERNWTYKWELNDGQNIETGEEKVITKACSNKDDCILYDSSSNRAISYYIFGGDIYAFDAYKVEVDQLKILSNETISEVVDRDQFELLGFDSDDEELAQVSFSCSVSLDDNYSFNYAIYSALIRECTTSYVDSVGGKGEFVSVDNYVKGIGVVTHYDDFYYDGVFQSSYIENLVDTNIVDIVENPFSDLSDSHNNIEAILYLEDIGVISGYPDGTFKPSNDVNRAELLKILVEGKGISPSLDDYKDCFPDVAIDWYAPYVCYALEEGWVDGYPDGSFKPSKTVNKVEAIKMLINSQSIDVSETLDQKPFDDVSITDWFAPFIAKAKELEILEETGTLLSPGDSMKRAGICENLYRLLTY